MSTAAPFDEENVQTYSGVPSTTCVEHLDADNKDGVTDFPLAPRIIYSAATSVRSITRFVIVPV